MGHTQHTTLKVVILPLCNFCLLLVGSMDRLPWQIEMENKQLKAAKTCKICLEADIEVVFIPCGHLVSCHGCSSLVSRCSLCQSSVTDTVKIYMS